METLHVLNGLIALVCAIVLGYIVLHREIHEGVVLKVGLLLMIAALLATAAHSFGDTRDWMALWTASFTLRLGLLVVGIGFIMRRRKKGSWGAALSDWGAL